MASDPIKELDDLIHGDRLPRVLTGQRQVDESNARDWFGYFTHFTETCHEAGSEFWRFFTDWFDSWLRVVLTGCVTGGIIGLVWRLLLPN